MLDLSSTACGFAYYIPMLYDRFSKELPFLQSEKLVSIKIQTDKTIAEYTIGTSERPTSTSALLWSPACAIFL